MKNFNKSLVGRVVIVSFVFALLIIIGSSLVFAATTPIYGVSATYGVLSSTYTNTSSGTTINGDVGFTTGPAVIPAGTHANYGSGAPYASAGTDQGAILSALSSEICTYTFPAGAIDLATDTTHGTAGTYTPGVYCTLGAASIGTGGITLNGNGTYIFRITGALTTVANSAIVLNGASSCDVFWTPTEATTLGANTTFAGTVIDPAGITIGANTVWSGIALAFGGTVTTDANSTITAPICSISIPPTPAILHVIKQVINNNGGISTPSQFNLHVKLLGTDVSGSPLPGTTSPGTPYSLSSSTYVVSEDSNTSYTQTFSGDCSSNGSITLVAGDDKTCTVTNDDIVVVSIPVATSTPISTTTPSSTYIPMSTPTSTPTLAKLHVIKYVININGGTAIPSNFIVYVKNSGFDVSGSPALGTSAPGTQYLLSPGTYTVSENLGISYRQGFTGDCNSSGSVTLSAGDDKTCTIVNTDIPFVTPTPTLVPSFPDTGLPPSSNSIYDIVILISILTFLSVSVIVFYRKKII